MQSATFSPPSIEIRVLNRNYIVRADNIMTDLRGGFPAS